MEFNLRGGALLIGSLFWQDDRNEEQGRKARKIWREQSLQMDKSINVSVPIRYGRFSGKAELGNQTYTMIFDSKLPAHLYGTAKAVPFKNENFSTPQDILQEADLMSAVEGKFCNFFIKSLPTDCAWCILSILINPGTVSGHIKKEIMTKWKEEMGKNKPGHEVLQKDYAQFSLKPTGELDIPWPAEAEGFDFLLSAATRPFLRDDIKTLDEAEIARFVHQREYFAVNRKHGIRTFQDDKIVQMIDDLHDQ